MRHFLSKLLWFNLIIMLALGGLMLTVNDLVDDNKYFELPLSNKYLILGHSQNECAFDDSLIDSARNLSQSGESYFYTYFKAKKLLQANKQIETLFLGFSNNQIKASMDRWIFGDMYLTTKGAKYAAFYDINDLGFLISKNPGATLSALSSSLKRSLYFLVVKRNVESYFKTNNWGGFRALQVNRVGSTTQSDLAANRNDSTDLSENNLKYLMKIVQLCKTRGVKLYLVRSPIYENYSFGNELAFSKILNTDLADVDFLDFRHFPLSSARYADEQHLNASGAAEFSIFFNSLIRQDSLTQIARRSRVVFDENVR